MRAHDDHRRRAGVGGRRARAPRPVRRRPVAAGGLTLALLGSGAAAAQAPTTVVTRDGADALAGAPDLRRVAATRSSDGSVRLAVSLAEELAAGDLLTDKDATGPPGSICVRLWTVSTPGKTRADLLACVTAQPDGKTLREHKEFLREANANKGRLIARHTGQTHAAVNAELNRVSGIVKVSQATVEQLEKRLDKADAWLKQASARRVAG
jgi:hypothetical protein